MEEKLLKDISKSLRLSEDELLRGSIASFLDRELKEAYSEIEELRVKYGVKNMEDLERKIERGEEGHPAWEELIEWENIENKIKEVENFSFRKLFY